MGTGTTTLDNSGFRNGTWNLFNWDWNPWRNQNPPTQSSSVITADSYQISQLNNIRDSLRVGSVLGQTYDLVAPPSLATAQMQQLVAARTQIDQTIGSITPNTANEGRIAQLRQLSESYGKQIEELQKVNMEVMNQPITVATNLAKIGIQPISLNS